MVDWLDTQGQIPAYLAAPENGAQGPGVIVLHSFWGLTPFFKRYCDRLAAAGFVAAAPDLYNGVLAATVAEATQKAQSLDFESTLVKALGVMQFLRIHPAVLGRGIGAVGFSLGGAWAFLLSNIEQNPAAAAVSYYGTTSGEFAASQAAYLAHFAPDDEWEPPEAIEALESSLRAAGRPVEFHLYPGTGHWIAEDDQPAYQSAAADLAFQRTVAFLDRHLRLPPGGQP